LRQATPVDAAEPCNNPAKRRTFPSYLLSWMTSGAIQCGVPMNVLRLVMVLVSCKREADKEQAAKQDVNICMHSTVHSQHTNSTVACALRHTFPQHPTYAAMPIS
jgi:hypothetical protein